MLLEWIVLFVGSNQSNNLDKIIINILRVFFFCMSICQRFSWNIILTEFYLPHTQFRAIWNIRKITSNESAVYSLKFHLLIENSVCFQLFPYF